MPSFAVLTTCATMLGIADAASAQSLDDFRPSFTEDEGTFDRPLRQFEFVAPPPPPPMELAIEIAGTQVSPDFKHRGLKIKVPLGRAVADEDNENAGPEREPR